MLRRRDCWVTKDGTEDGTAHHRITEELRAELEIEANRLAQSQARSNAPESLPPVPDQSTTQRVISIASILARERPALVTVAGIDAGQVRELDKPIIVIGRAQDVDFMIDDPALSRRHAKIVLTPNGFFIEDLKSKNGTLVDGLAVTVSSLQAGARIQLGPNVLLRFAVLDEQDMAAHRNLYTAATRDALTGALNRRQLEATIATEVACAARNKTPLSLLVLDIDHFKRVNDTLGHGAGDATIRAIVSAITMRLRAGDSLGRFGGEEFIVVCRATAREEARDVGERLRRTVEGLPIAHDGRDIRVTISLGAASLGEAGVTNSEELVARADARLYRAKHSGRNRVCAD